MVFCGFINIFSFSQYGFKVQSCTWFWLRFWLCPWGLGAVSVMREHGRLCTVFGGLGGIYPHNEGHYACIMRSSLWYAERLRMTVAWAVVLRYAITPHGAGW